MCAGGPTTAARSEGDYKPLVEKGRRVTKQYCPGKRTGRAGDLTAGATAAAATAEAPPSSRADPPARRVVPSPPMRRPARQLFTLCSLLSLLLCLSLCVLWARSYWVADNLVVHWG